MTLKVFTWSQCQTQCSHRSAWFTKWSITIDTKVKCPYLNSTFYWRSINLEPAVGIIIYFMALHSYILILQDATYSWWIRLLSQILLTCLFFHGKRLSGVWEWGPWDLQFLTWENDSSPFIFFPGIPIPWESLQPIHLMSVYLCIQCTLSKFLTKSTNHLLPVSCLLSLFWSFGVKR